MSISQREARRLRKRVDELEQRESVRRNRWSTQWPRGVEIASTKWGQGDQVPVAVRTARALRHAVVVTEDNQGMVRFIALPLPEDGA